MDVLYLKKEAAVKTCIDQGEKIFSSYQMQVIKSKFYTAITFDRDSDEYKRRMDELYKKLKAYVDNNGISQVNVYREDTGVSVVIVDNLIFDTGDANVKPEAKEIISKLQYLQINLELFLLEKSFIIFNF